jgi:hypothetical protein
MHIYSHILIILCRTSINKVSVRGETCTDPQGGYPSGCRLSSGGSIPKSVGGSSWMNSELGENGKDTVVLDWFRPPESKTLRPVWWDYAWKESSPQMEL